MPEARHFSVTRYATQERAGTAHLQAVSVPEARHSSDILSRSPLAKAVRAGGTVSSDILLHSPLAETVRAEGTVSSDILSRSPLAKVQSLRIYSRTAHWLRRYVPEALSLRISSRAAHWLSQYVPEARHFSVTRYATQERAGTVHLQPSACRRYATALFIVEKFVLATRCGYLYQKMR